MQSHARVQVVLGVLLSVTLLCRGQSPAPDERGLWLAWVASTNAPDDHESLVATCKCFRAQSPRDPLAVVVAGIEAWHLLKLEKNREAAALLEPMLTLPDNPTYLQTAAAEQARAWLTRLDREKVKGALKKVFMRDIEFPVSLDFVKSLGTATLPPMTDRWGKPWTYHRQSKIKGMETQQYVLQSTRLKSRSDLAKALKVPYASRLTLQPVRLSSVSADAVEFKTALGKPAMLLAGGDLDDILIAYVGANIIVMADEDHWRVVLKPRQ